MTQHEDPIEKDSTKTTPQPSKSRGRMGCSLAAVALIVIMIGGAALGAPMLMAFLSNGSTTDNELVDGAAHSLFVEQRDGALTQLNNYRWVDQEAGVAAVPIDRAITLLVASDLEIGAPAAMTTSDEPGATDLSDVNFNDDVLPIFMQHCSECHGEDNPDEGLVLTSYDDVMLGSIYGSVIKPNDVEGSYLVELVESGQMPKRGEDLTPAEIETIIAWVEAGAPETGTDGDDASDGSGETAAVTPETVSFQGDVLPLLIEHCAECHGDDDPDEGLVLTSYDDVMFGSIYGSVIKPNDVAGSYLIELVESGQMPKRGDDLTADQVAVLVAWVEAGAPDN